MLKLQKRGKKFCLNLKSMLNICKSVYGSIHKPKIKSLKSIYKPKIKSLKSRSLCKTNFCDILGNKISQKHGKINKNVKQKYKFIHYMLISENKSK